MSNQELYKNYHLTNKNEIISQAHNKPQNNNFVRCSDMLFNLSYIKNICKTAYYYSSLEAESPFLQNILKTLCDETQILIDGVNQKPC